MRVSHANKLTAPGILGVFGIAPPKPVAKMVCFTLNIRSAPFRLTVTFQRFELGSWIALVTVEEVQMLSSSVSA